MRWALALVIAIGLAGSAAYAGWDHLSAFWTRRQEGDDWRQRELRFLKAAYDRLDAQLAKQPDKSGADSLRGEQDVIRRMMAETARALPAETLPPEIRVVVSPTGVAESRSVAALPSQAQDPPHDTSLPAAAISPAAAASPSVTAAPVKTPPPPPIVLRAGLSPPPDANTALFELSRDPGLDRKLDDRRRRTSNAATRPQVITSSPTMPAN
jgi:hypothetical protein